MKILIFWDIFWRIWRSALKKELPKLKEKYNPDFIIANVDNASSGRWIIEKHALELEKMWIDVMTWGDHIFDNFDKIKNYLDKPDSKLIRCANFYNDENLEWKGYKIIENNWKKLLIIHIIDEIFMNHKVDNPFKVVEKIIIKNPLGEVDWIIVDFHKEVTSSWYWLSFFLDWKASFVYWTHTHIQTNDELILENGIWLISDIWMSWPLYSVIWADYKSVEKRFLTWVNKWKINQCLNSNYVVSWVCVELDDFWKCKNIEKIRIIGKL